MNVIDGEIVYQAGAHLFAGCKLLEVRLYV